MRANTHGGAEWASGAPRTSQAHRAVPKVPLPWAVAALVLTMVLAAAPFARALWPSVTGLLGLTIACMGTGYLILLAAFGRLRPSVSTLASVGVGLLGLMLALCLLRPMGLLWGHGVLIAWVALGITGSGLWIRHWREASESEQGISIYAVVVMMVITLAYTSAASRSVHPLPDGSLQFGFTDAAFFSASVAAAHQSPPEHPSLPGATLRYHYFVMEVAGGVATALPLGPMDALWRVVHPLCLLAILLGLSGLGVAVAGHGQGRFVAALGPLIACCIGSAHVLALFARRCLTAARGAPWEGLPWPNPAAGFNADVLGSLGGLGLGLTLVTTATLVALWDPARRPWAGPLLGAIMATGLGLNLLLGPLHLVGVVVVAIAAVVWHRLPVSWAMATVAACAVTMWLVAARVLGPIGSTEALSPQHEAVGWVVGRWGALHHARLWLAGVAAVVLARHLLTVYLAAGLCTVLGMASMWPTELSPTYLSVGSAHMIVLAAIVGAVVLASGPCEALWRRPRAMRWASVICGGLLGLSAAYYGANLLAMGLTVGRVLWSLSGLGVGMCGGWVLSWWVPPACAANRASSTVRRVGVVALSGFLALCLVLNSQFMVGGQYGGIMDARLVDRLTELDQKLPSDARVGCPAGLFEDRTDLVHNVVDELNYTPGRWSSPLTPRSMAMVHGRPVGQSDRAWVLLRFGYPTLLGRPVASSSWRRGAYAGHVDDEAAAQAFERELAAVFEATDPSAAADGARSLGLDYLLVRAPGRPDWASSPDGLDLVSPGPVLAVYAVGPDGASGGPDSAPASRPSTDRTAN
ncbi:MAG: hypothetical protein GF320_18545 [Armatimonadia bacterium]|nr:hypothetical protein [Armatimonadia bacterium]